MISICVFRRYGIAVPILLIAIGFLLEKWMNAKHGDGYYTSTTWPIGINLLASGILTGLLSCIVDPASSNDYVYSAIRDGDIEDIKQNLGDTFDKFVYEETSEDMFCYIPLNRCALGLMVSGIGLIVFGLVSPS